MSSIHIHLCDICWRHASCGKDESISYMYGAAVLPNVPPGKMLCNGRNQANWHPGNRCGWTCNQLTSKVDGGITGSRLRWSILTYCATPWSGNRVSTSLGNSGLCLTIFVRNRDTAVPAEGSSDLHSFVSLWVERPRWCPTLLNPVPWKNWMAAYLGYILRMKTLFRGWPVMVHDTHTRRRLAPPPINACTAGLL